MRYRYHQIPVGPILSTYQPLGRFAPVGVADGGVIYR